MSNSEVCDDLGQLASALGRSKPTFSVTSSSLVQAAAAGCRKARSTLWGTYWRPIRRLFLGLGLRSDQADDAVQAFFLSLEQRNDLVRFDRARARFRTWLSACAWHFVYRFRKTQRIHEARFPSLERVSQAPEYEDAQWEGTSPEQLLLEVEVFDVLECSRLELWRWYQEHGCAHIYRELVDSLNGPDPIPDCEHVRRLGGSRDGLRQHRHRLRLRFAECLVAEMKRRGVGEAWIPDRLRFYDRVLSRRERKELPP